MERAVGWFVMLAVALLVFGFGYYIHNTAKRKGWFLTKAPYFTFLSNSSGLRVGDPVKLMGFDAGRITAIKPMPGDDFTYNVYVEFELMDPNFGYMWTEGSYARVAAADLLGKRMLEVTKGSNGYPTYLFHPLRELTIGEAHSVANNPRWKLAEEVYDQAGTTRILPALQPLTNVSAIAAEGHTTIRVVDTGETRKSMTAVWNDRQARYEPYDRSKKYWLLSDESPALADRLESLVSQVQRSLPGVFALTNELSQVLSNASELTSNLSLVALSAQPAVSNLAAATAHLDQPGALGNWLIPTNLNARLDSSLANANETLVAANSNLNALASNLGRSLDNLAGITSNLNAQVEANTNILSSISQTIVDADRFIQGLKRHWLLRSAFREETAPKPRPSRSAPPVRSPRDAGSR
jgi:ABC-type transporter Mla subunit MlaD